MSFTQVTSLFFSSLSHDKQGYNLLELRSIEGYACFLAKRADTTLGDGEVVDRDGQKHCHNLFERSIRTIQPLPHLIHILLVIVFRFQMGICQQLTVPDFLHADFADGSPSFRIEASGSTLSEAPRGQLNQSASACRSVETSRRVQPVTSFGACICHFS